MANNHHPQHPHQGGVGQPPEPPVYQPPSVPQTPTTPQNPQLQAQPITSETQDGTAPVWVARPVVPEAPEVPEEAMKRHEMSMSKYPELNLSKGEFVISAIRRHPIGLISIWAVAVLIIVLSLAILVFITANSNAFLEPFGITADGVTAATFLAIPFLLLVILVAVGALISTWVYTQNKFFLTNESVIQFIQISLFSRNEQTVSLANIEDASYRKQGILQHIFDYGNLRLSTQGDETTYRFNYVSNPRHQVALLNNAVEAFKMGRPVMHIEDTEY